jgi:hypothetical protein
MDIFSDKVSVELVENSKGRIVKLFDQFPFAVLGLLNLGGVQPAGRNPGNGRLQCAGGRHR